MYQCKLGLITAAVLLGLPVSAGVADLPVWHSYDATIRTASGDLNRGDILDANHGINAALKFYLSSDDLGVAEASSAPTGGTGIYDTQPHGAWTGDGLDIDLTTGYWALPGGNGAQYSNLTAADWFANFAGKQLAPRPSDGSHGALPGNVTGVNDLAFHPGNTWEGDGIAWENKLGVIAFVAPWDGDYTITNFGARAMQPQGGNNPPDRSNQSVYIIDDRTGFVVKDSIVAGGIIGGPVRDMTWKLSGNTTTMHLSAGEDIHFAVHCTDALVPVLNGTGQEFFWDGTNVAFDIEGNPDSFLNTFNWTDMATAADHDWATPGNWDTLPTSLDKAIVGGGNPPEAAEVNADASVHTLEIRNAGAVNVNAGCTLTVTDDLDILDGRLTIAGTAAVSGDVTINDAGGKLTIDAGSNGLLSSGGSVTLGGQLELVVEDRFAGEDFGDHALTVVEATGAGDISGTFSSPPAVGHIRRGVFFESMDYTNDKATVANVFQAIPGDTDGDRDFDFNDLIEMFSKSGPDYGNVMPSGSEKDWTIGDFTGDGNFMFDDLIAAFSKAGPSYGNPTYTGMTESELPEDASIGLAVNAVPEPGTVLMLLSGSAGLGLWWRRPSSTRQSGTLRNSKCAGLCTQERKSQVF